MSVSAENVDDVTEHGGNLDDVQTAGASPQTVSPKLWTPTLMYVLSANWERLAFENTSRRDWEG